MIKVFVAGATGWAGSAISKGIFNHDGMQLIGGLSRSNKGKNLADILQIENATIPLFDTIDNALEKIDFDVLVEFTKPDIAKKNIITALEKGKNVIIGTSGLSNEDYNEIESIANKNNASVLAAGNFAITAVLLFKFAAIAAKYIPNYELIDYASQNKVDAPSGSVAELAHRLSAVQKSTIEVPIEDTIGVKETRGATIDDVQVHSVRLPGHVLGIEAIFGMQDEKLILRHDAGNGAEPYVNGVILAIEKVNSFKGLKRGLDTVMDL
ncbi:dihydrodipicolinate reductase [Chishuiella changwenlii]|uniref:4-hydroxy-tetrahydrodipicolinate reductase n=1 Tax=Chishuiella changwenlii TaxID=1434701 RepID=A0A1M6UZT2_9FLAO|nr:4-hydroxy-tetrahydrodipicolinate reductase [Chishuiella changwenlii]GGF02281.1 4-hydroxy-tetrahydrodipicolinate reductase [Chishuiella changwenlii]SHK74566.1 dihydrodipicolinate reductase [Chishuiella changwenlii]